MVEQSGTMDLRFTLARNLFCYIFECFSYGSVTVSIGGHVFLFLESYRKFA